MGVLDNRLASDSSFVRAELVEICTQIMREKNTLASLTELVVQ